MSGASPAWRRFVRAGVVIVALLLAPVVVTYGLADWSSRRELARVREAFAPHAGAGPTPDDAMDRKSNETARRLMEIFATPGLRMARARARRFPNAELQRASIEPAPSDAEWRATWMDAEPGIEEVRTTLLAGTAPRWRSVRHGLRWEEPDIYGASDLMEPLVASALEHERAGESDRAAADMEAAWILVESLREGRSSDSTRLALAAMTMVAAAARKIDALGPEWEGRLDVDTMRDATLDDLRLECRGLLAAAHGPDVARAMAQREIRPPAWARPFDFLVVPTLRRHLAQQVEANIPVIAALEDPSRCGPASLAPLLAQSAVDAGRPGMFGTIEAEARVPAAYDACRLQLDLTRQLLRLRAQRNADPDHRWPEQLGADGGSRCPGVRFVLRRPTPELLVIEAESLEGEWWERGGPALRVEIPVESP